MAKKDPMDLSVEDKLKTLYQLQTTQSAIDEKRAHRGELPFKVEDLEDEIEGHTPRNKKSDLHDILAETRAEEERLKLKTLELAAKIEPRLLLSFQRIRKNARNGLGVVYVQRDACGGCFNKIPPQRQLDIKMHKKIIVCEYCGRIMIDPELAGVKIEKTGVEDKKTRKRAIRRKKADEE